MRGCVVMFAIAAAALAYEASGAQAGTTVPSGVPLRVALEHRVAIKHAGQPIPGRLVDPVYVFDREVLPAGSIVEGHIAEVGGVPVRRRLVAILSGNFTPPREVRTQFDALVLSNGARLSLRTSLSRGTAHTLRIAAQRKKRNEHESTLEGVRNRLEDKDRAAILAFTAPGKMSRLKSTLFGMLPYHRQAWPAGTLFNGVLQEPLTAPPPSPAEVRIDHPAAAQPEDQQLNARLLTPICSSTARRGTTVEAAVTRPLFSTDHRLLIPEGSRLLGTVVEAQPARRFHRNGKLIFVFRQMRPPTGTAQNIQGYLEGVEADFDAHLVLDSEGATHASSPKTRFISPAISMVVAGLSLHQDYNAQGVPDQDVGGRAESGAVGLGLIGTLLAQASRTLASSIAFTGAGFSVYSTFLARGQEVALPVNTPVKISLGARGGEAPGGQPAKQRPR